MLDPRSGLADWLAGARMHPGWVASRELDLGPDGYLVEQGEGDDNLIWGTVIGGVRFPA
jgi:hypothetical protein